jgi:ATP-dependent Clp protease ATP-binding subunit ClpA
MFERFTADAREVVFGAVLVADELGSPVIGTEHLLVALSVGDGAGGDALRAAGATGDRLRAELAEHRGPVDGVPAPDPDALASIGIDVEEVRRAVEETFGPGALAGRPDRGRRRWWNRSAERFGHKRFTGEAKAVLARAVREAVARDDRQIGSDHVLLGLIGPAGLPPASAGTGLLAACGVELAQLRAALPHRRREAG